MPSGWAPTALTSSWSACARRSTPTASGSGNGRGAGASSGQGGMDPIRTRPGSRTTKEVGRRSPNLLIRSRTAEGSCFLAGAGKRRRITPVPPWPPAWTSCPKSLSSVSRTRPPRARGRSLRCPSHHAPSPPRPRRRAPKGGARVPLRNRSSRRPGSAWLPDQDRAVSEEAVSTMSSCDTASAAYASAARMSSAVR